MAGLKIGQRGRARLAARKAKSTKSSAPAKKSSPKPKVPKPVTAQSKRVKRKAHASRVITGTIKGMFGIK